LAGGFVSILILRLILGLGESVTFPGCQLLLARHMVENERGRANGFIGAGQGIGPMLGTLFGGLAMAQFGWRVLFVGPGVMTVLWIWPWFMVARRGVIRAPQGRWAGAQNLTGQCAGVVAPMVTGYIVERTGSFSWAFIVTATISMLGMIAWGLIIRRIEQLPWSNESLPRVPPFLHHERV
jgi:MFS family permease